MPAQQSPRVQWHMLPRRFQILFAVIVTLVLSLVFYGPPSSADLPSIEQVKDQVKDQVKNPHLPSLPDLPDLPNLPELPSVPHPFGPAAHKPPVQAGSNATSSYGAIQWLYDFKWRNPFSSSVTLDENTAVLPPLKERPPIYTYYEPRSKQSKAVTEAENRLILAWRRAWWAQGFRPQVLSRAEATKHPQYEIVQRLRLDKIDPSVELEIMRWLAWGYMKGGILSNWLALPMAKYNNPMLRFLRRNEYPKLSRVESLQDGFFFGDAKAVNEAIKKAVSDKRFAEASADKQKIIDLKKDGGAMVNLLPATDLAIESRSHGIAYYSSSVIKSKYKAVSDTLTNSTNVEGLELLASLINAHLHLTFQNTFTEGVAVLKPLPEHTTALMYEAIDIARNLTQCPSTPLPSCPPNKPRCIPCDPTKPLNLELMPAMKNSSALYTIGTVPHPYTLTSLHYARDQIDAGFLRREAGRDRWINAATSELFPPKHSNDDRIVHFKETVAAPQKASNSLWLTAERVSQEDLEWIFGFKLPHSEKLKQSSDAKNGFTIYPRPEGPKPIKDVKAPDEASEEAEKERLKKARGVLQMKDKLWLEVVNMVEQWNLVDTEAWRFARAWSARRRQERKKWEAEEAKSAGSEKKAGVQGGGSLRWSD